MNRQDGHFNITRSPIMSTLQLHKVANSLNTRLRGAKQAFFLPKFILPIGVYLVHSSVKLLYFYEQYLATGNLLQLGHTAVQLVLQSGQPV